MSENDSQPFIALPTEAEVRARMKPGTKNPYDFGFIAGMSRLLSAHERMADGFGLKPDPQLREAAAAGVPLRRSSG